MKRIKKPIVAAAAMALGIALGEQRYGFSYLPFLIVLSFLLIILALYRDRKTVAIFLVFMILGYSIYSLHEFKKAKRLDSIPTDQTIEIQGRVSGFPFKDNQNRWRFQLEEFSILKENSWHSQGGKVDVYLENKEDQLYPPGTFIWLKGSLGLQGGRVNFGDPNWDLIQKRKNIVARFFAQEGKTLGGPTLTDPLASIWKLRRNLYMALYSKGQDGNPKLQEETASLLMSLSFGVADDLAEDLIENFQKAGLLHLLAVSGGNVAFFIVGLGLFLNRLLLSRKSEYFLYLALIMFFMLLTELEPSVVRAGIMAIIVFSAKIILRRTHWSTILALMLLILLPLWPNLLFETGFLLSLGAVWGLFVFTRPISTALKKRLKLADFLIFPMAATLAAQIGVLPLSLYYFQEVSLIAPLSNLVFTPLIIPAMPLLLLLWLSIPFSSLFFWLYGLAEAYAWLLIKTGSLFASLPMSSLYLPKPSLSVVYLAYIFLFFLSSGILPKYKSLVKKTALSFLLILALLCWHPWPYKLEVHMIDVGQGDCIFLRLPNGKTILVDGGGSGTGSSEIGKKTVLPYLKRLGLNSLDVLLLSHGHSDHFQGLIQVGDKLPYKKFLHGLADLTNLPAELTDWLSQQPESQKILLFEGDQIVLDKDVSIEVVQSQVFKDGGNDDSLVIHLVYQGTDLWLAGDLEREGEFALLPKIRAIEAQTLFKVSHHGGASSCSPEFLGKITPEISIISVAVNNRYNHPADSTLEILKRHNSIVLTTAAQGGIICQSNGRYWTWRTCLP